MRVPTNIRRLVRVGTTIAVVSACLAAVGIVAAGAALSNAKAAPATVRPHASSCSTYYVVSEFGPANPFMAVEAKGVDQAAAALHIRAVFSGPSGTTGSIPVMLSLLQSAIAAQPCGIATQLADPTALNGALNLAIGRKIPVVLWNAQDFKPGNNAISRLQYVGQDETVSGEKLGTHLLSYLHSGATVVYGMDFPGELVGTYRYNGVKSILAAHGIKTVLVDVGSDPTSGVTTLSAYLASHPGVKAIVSNGVPSDEAAVDYAEQSGHKGKYVIASFDMASPVVTAIQQGYQNFVLDQQPYLQGYLAIVDLYQMHRGFSAFSANTGTLFVDKTNVNQFATLVTQGIGG